MKNKSIKKKLSVSKSKSRQNKTKKRSRKNILKGGGPEGEVIVPSIDSHEFKKFIGKHKNYKIIEEFIIEMDDIISDLNVELSFIPRTTTGVGKTEYNKKDIERLQSEILHAQNEKYTAPQVKQVYEWFKEDYIEELAKNRKNRNNIQHRHANIKKQGRRSTYL